MFIKMEKVQPPTLAVKNNDGSTIMVIEVNLDDPYVFADDVIVYGEDGEFMARLDTINNQVQIDD